jgi:hypothetical protein
MTDLAQAAAWHRQAAAVAAAAARTGVRHDDLTRVRERLLAQQGRFSEVAALAETELPSLVPTPAEVTTAAPALGDGSVEAVAAALRTASSTLDAADAALTTMAADPASAIPRQSSRRPSATPPAGAAEARAGAAEAQVEESQLPVAARNAVIYGLYAIGMLGLQIPFLLFITESQLLSLAADLVVLPAFAWAAGWATIGWAYKPQPGQKATDRSPRLGLIVCILADLFLCAGYFTFSG